MAVGVHVSAWFSFSRPVKVVAAPLPSLAPLQHGLKQTRGKCGKSCKCGFTQHNTKWRPSESPFTLLFPCNALYLKCV